VSAGDPKVYIVTGALGGIGRATSRLLAETGAHLVLTDIADEGGARLADSLTAAGGEALFFAADVGDEDQVRATVDLAVTRFGKLDGAFNNAGVEQHGKPITDLTHDEWRHVMRINADGVFFCLKHQMRAMTQGGSIVVTSSGLGVRAIQNTAEYTASKHAVCGLTRAAATEGAAVGIRVNAIIPGVVRTPMMERQLGSLDGPDAVQLARDLQLIGRFCEPEDIGYLVRWLLSDEAAMVTGALYPVDGGASAGRPVRHKGTEPRA